MSEIDPFRLKLCREAAEAEARRAPDLDLEAIEADYIKWLQGCRAEVVWRSMEKHTPALIAAVRERDTRVRELEAALAEMTKARDWQRVTELEAEVEHRKEMADALGNRGEKWRAELQRTREHVGELEATLEVAERRTIEAEAATLRFFEECREEIAKAAQAERARCVGMATKSIMGEIFLPCRLAVLANVLLAIESHQESPAPCPACGSPLADQSDDCQGGGTDTANVGGETRHCRCLPQGASPAGA